jgi:DNA-3-methyladenine glycosylase II
VNYKTALSKDRKLKKILQTEIVIPPVNKNITQALVWSILSQQLSIVVAKVLYGRFLDLFGGRVPTASQILELSKDQIRSIGVSERKAEYILNVAQFIVDHKITFTKLQKMDDGEVIDLLSQIKGVGRWTVEMLLMFGLGREDVFAVDDLGIQKAMIELFNLGDLTKKELRLKMMELSKRWSPYRTYVCLHIWKFSGFRK